MIIEEQIHDETERKNDNFQFHVGLCRKRKRKKKVHGTDSLIFNKW